MGKKRLNMVKKFNGKNYAFGGNNSTKTEAKDRADRYRSQGYKARVVKTSIRTTGAAIAHHPHPNKRISMTVYKVYVRKSRK